MGDERATSSGMLSLIELRRHLLREASMLATRAEHVRRRGEPMQARTLKRRSERILEAAQRISQRLPEG